MSKVIRLCAVAFLFAIASGTAQASIYFDVDQDNFETNGASSISISVYLAADDEMSVTALGAGLTADYEFLTIHGLASAGVRLTRVGGPVNPPVVSGATPNPDFIVGGGATLFPYSSLPDPDNLPNLDPDAIGLSVVLDPNRGMFDGFGVRVSPDVPVDEAEAVIPLQLYRVLLGTFTFTVPASSLEGDVTTYRLADLFVGANGDTFSTDGTDLDLSILDAEFTITTTPEPASCVAWTGLMLLAFGGRYYRLHKRRVIVSSDQLH